MDGTANITASEAPPRRVAAPSHRGAALVGVGIAGLLLALGAPRLIAAALSLDSREALWDVYQRDALPPDRLAAAAEGLAAADRWVGDGVAESQRGLLLMRQAGAAATVADRDRLHRAALVATEAGLAMAPGDPSAWYRLAHLRVLAGDAAGAVSALRLSMLAGAVVPDLMVPRLELGLMLLARMDADTAGLFDRQIRLTWVILPDALADLSRGGHGARIQAALAGLEEEEMAHYLRLHRARP